MPGGQVDRIRLDSELRRAGLAGRWMNAGLDGDRLVLSGEKGGSGSIALADVVRMRVGFNESRNGDTYVVCLWRSGRAAPVRLAPFPPLHDPRAYAELVRQIARQVSARRGIASVETGSPGRSLGSILTMAVAVVASYFIAAGYLVDVPEASWWWVPAIVAVPVLLELILLWRYLRVHRPRPIAELADLEPHLPDARGAPGGNARSGM